MLSTSQKIHDKVNEKIQTPSWFGSELVHHLVSHLIFRAWFIWGIVFCLLAVMNWEYPSTNPHSRMVALSAMSQRSTFNIDGYDLDIDWSRTPDGRTFSNKAPGPALLGYPMTWIWDRVKLLDSSQELVDLDRRSRGYHFLLSFIHQMILIFALGYYIQSYLKSKGASLVAQEIALVGLYFGSTASILANTYFGHSLGAALFLAMILASENRHWKWTGFLLGWSLLSDYSTVYVLPAVVLAYWVRAKNDPDGISGLRKLRDLVLGGMIPGVLWIWYHTSCFGSPWSLPYAFQNPIFTQVVQQTTQQAFQETSALETKFWGQLSLFFDFKILMKLLGSGERGLLWTQPWILFLAILGPFIKGVGRPELRFLSLLLGGSLFGLLWMNASFFGWHGGHAPGPRYLCLVFLAYGLLLGLTWDVISAWVKGLMLAGLVYSVVFRLLVYAHGVLAPPDQDLLVFFSREVLFSFSQERSSPSLRPLITFVVTAVLFFLLGWARFRYLKKEKVK